MRTADLLGLALSALWQQKARTLLTALGVTCASFTLAASLSARQGVQRAVAAQYRYSGVLHRVDVFASIRPADAAPPPAEVAVQGEMSDAKRQRLRGELARRWRQSRPSGERVGLTPERIRRLLAVEHVAAVVPRLNNEAVEVRVGGQAGGANVVAAAAGDEFWRSCVVAGGYFPADDSPAVLVSEFLLYTMGFADDAEVDRLVGGPVTVEYRPTGGVSPRYLGVLLGASFSDLTPEHDKALQKLIDRLPAALDGMPLGPAERELLGPLLKARNPPAAAGAAAAAELTLAGVFRRPRDDEPPARWNWEYLQADIVLPPRTAEKLLFGVPDVAERGLNHAFVQVDAGENVKAVQREVEALGLQANSLAEVIEREQFIYLMVFTSMTFVALVALLVAGLGIANTMLMSVLERVREIGVMKAVGGREGQIQTIFLTEGALLGLAGGLLGLALAWAASFPADAWTRSLVARRINVELRESVFSFPWWLLAGVPLFTTAVTTLAALYPARRAARVNPILALRHE